jgi:hypothetical protein
MISEATFTMAKKSKGKRQKALALRAEPASGGKDLFAANYLA